jgi:hypothetical protein
MTTDDWCKAFEAGHIIGVTRDEAVRFLLVKAGINDHDDTIAKESGWDGVARHVWVMVIPWLPGTYTIVIKVLGTADDGYLAYVLNKQFFTEQQAADMAVKCSKWISGKVHVVSPKRDHKNN